MIGWADFHFLRPMWLLALIPFLVILWMLARRKLGGGNWASVCDPELLPHILMHTPARSRRWPVIVLSLAGVLCILALAGPTWQRLPQPVYRDQAALIIALDLSRSMDATDISPSRLTRAKYKIEDILRQRRMGQTALLVYAGDAFTVSPLTDDTATIINQLSALTTDLMPIQGSRADRALRKAMALLEQAGRDRGDILLITDNVHYAATIEAVEALGDKGYRLSVMGIGTTEGAPVPLKGGGFLKDAQGNIVIPKLDSDRLKDLARAGGGLYLTMRVDDQDIKSLAAMLDSHPLTERARRTDLKADIWREQGPWLLLLVLPMAALAFRRGYLVVAFLLVFSGQQPVYAVDWSSFWSRPDQQASRALELGDAQKAAELFTNSAWKGAAHYRAGNYEQALKSLKDLHDVDSWYNKGNALARLGRYPQAIQAYKEALKLNPNHEDARYNLKLIQKALEQQQQKAQSGQGQTQTQSGQGQTQADQSGAPGPPHSMSSPQQARPDDRNQTQNNPANATPRRQAPQPDDQATVNSTPPSEKNEQGKQATSTRTEPQNGTQQHAETESMHGEQAQQGQSQDDKPNEAYNAENMLKGTDESARPDARRSPTDNVSDESQLAIEQWLRRIPDDPGGLLRRKFYYQYQQPSRAHSEELEPW
jgi:Ca-activated chloride channel family protein